MLSAEPALHCVVVVCWALCAAHAGWAGHGAGASSLAQLQQVGAALAHLYRNRVAVKQQKRSLLWQDNSSITKCSELRSAVVLCCTCCTRCHWMLPQLYTVHSSNSPATSAQTALPPVQRSAPVRCCAALSRSSAPWPAGCASVLRVSQHHKHMATNSPWRCQHAHY